MSVGAEFLSMVRFQRETEVAGITCFMPKFSLSCKWQRGQVCSVCDAVAFMRDQSNKMLQILFYMHLLKQTLQTCKPGQMSDRNDTTFMVDGE